MSLFRKAARRDQTEADIVQVLRKCGWSVLQVSVKDGPDLFAAKTWRVDASVAGHAFTFKRVVAIECKTGTKKLRPGQEAFRANWQGEYVVLRSVEDALALNQESR